MLCSLANELNPGEGRGILWSGTGWSEARWLSRLAIRIQSEGGLGTGTRNLWVWRRLQGASVKTELIVGQPAAATESHDVWKTLFLVSVVLWFYCV